jgi:hypothetical protein
MDAIPLDAVAAALERLLVRSAVEARQ